MLDQFGVWFDSGW